MNREATGDHFSSHSLSNPVILAPSISNLSAKRLPKLVLISQTPPVKQVESEDGHEDEQQKNVHVVVKNVPFTIELGLENVAGAEEINLNHFSFDGKLLYDTPDGQEKEVDYVTVQPVEVRRFNLNQLGNHIKLQLRIKVLSSHHENLAFRVKIHAINPISGTSLLTVLSEPVKVISKPERKKKPAPSPATVAPPRTSSTIVIGGGLISTTTNVSSAASAFTTASLGSSRLSSDSLPSSPSDEEEQEAISILGKKRTSEDRLREAIEAIEERQSQQQLLIERLMKVVENRKIEERGRPGSAEVKSSAIVGSTSGLGHPNESDAGGNPATAEDFDPWELNKLKEWGFDAMDAPVEDTLFDAAFNNFLMLYNTLSAEEKPSKIRKLTRNCSQQGEERVNHFLNLLSTEGIQRLRKSSSGCACGVCPYQVQLEQIDKDPFVLPPTMGNDLSVYM